MAETSTFVCAEVQWVLKRQYDVPKPLRIEALASIVEWNNLSLVQTDDLPHALSLFVDHEVKFIDALIGAYVLTKEIPVVSYDTDFDTLGCERLEPGEGVSSN